MNDFYINTVLRACNDTRYTAYHFILSEVNSEFLRHWKIDSRVKDFKLLVKKSRPAFSTSAGNQRKAPYMRVKVYDIRDFLKNS